MEKKGQGMGKSAACAKTPGRDCSKHSGGFGGGGWGGGGVAGLMLRDPVHFIYSFSL